MIDLSLIRQEARVTQAEMATRLSTTQSSVSQLERRDDLRLTTLVDYLNALGAEACITVRIGDETYEYNLTGDQH